MTEKWKTILNKKLKVGALSIVGKIKCVLF